MVVLHDLGHLRRHGAGHLVLFLPLHPAVLEPYLDLPFAETERMGDFDSPSPGQIAVEMKLFFQFQSLVASVRRALSLGLAHCVDSILSDVHFSHPRVNLRRVIYIVIFLILLALVLLWRLGVLLW